MPPRRTFGDRKENPSPRDEGVPFLVRSIASPATAMTALHRLPRRVFAALSLALAALGAASVPAAASAASACSARSAATPPAVIELYTSEGCSSCPPAERWLSGLKGRDDVVALAFHVDYWDGLGWKDRFARPAFTQRQNATQRTSGARFAYTPQVLVDGRDAPDWPSLPATTPHARAASTVALQLDRDASGLLLTVTPGRGAPAMLSGYVAVVDDGLRTRVGAGENRGATLHEDGIVRELLPWSLDAGRPATFHFTPGTPLEAGAARRWVAVATDGPLGRPVQAVTLACGG